MLQPGPESTALVMRFSLIMPDWQAVFARSALIPET